MTTPPSNAKRKWLPVLLSAAIYPGAGQFLQRRWLAGLIYSTSFSAAFVWFCWLTLYPAFLNLQAAMNGMGEDFIPPDWPEILFAIGLCIVVYGLSLADTLWAGRRPKA